MSWFWRMCLHFIWHSSFLDILFDSKPYGLFFLSTSFRLTRPHSVGLPHRDSQIFHYSGPSRCPSAILGRYTRSLHDHSASSLPIFRSGLKIAMATVLANVPSPRMYSPGRKTEIRHATMRSTQPRTPSPEMPVLLVRHPSFSYLIIGYYLLCSSGCERTCSFGDSIREPGILASFTQSQPLSFFVHSLMLLLLIRIVLPICNRDQTI